MAAGWQIQGRDAFSATSGTGAVDFAPINIGTAAGAGAGSSGLSSTTVLIGAVLLALVAVVLVKRRR